MHRASFIILLSCSSCSLLFEASESSDGGVMAQSDSMISADAANAADAADATPIDTTPVLLMHAERGTLTTGVGNEAGGAVFAPVLCSPPAVAVGVKSSTYQYRYDGAVLDNTYLCNFHLLCQSVQASNGRVTKTGPIAAMPQTLGLGSCEMTGEELVPVVIGDEIDLLCPNEDVVVGLSLAQAQTPPLTAFLQVKLKCGDVSSDGVAGTTTLAPESIGDLSLESELFDIDCSIGQVVVGMEGRSGASLDSVALRCDGLTP